MLKSKTCLEQIHTWKRKFWTIFTINSLGNLYSKGHLRVGGPLPPFGKKEPQGIVGLVPIFPVTLATTSWGRNQHLTKRQPASGSLATCEEAWSGTGLKQSKSLLGSLNLRQRERDPEKKKIRPTYRYSSPVSTQKTRDVGRRSQWANALRQ